MKNQKFMQFSKKIVVAVTLMVTIVCLASIVLAWQMDSSNSMTQIVKAYINYAIIVFASYTGNSVTEKVLSARMNNHVDESSNEQG